MAGRPTCATKRSPYSTGLIPSLTEVDIPHIADIVIQAMTTRSCESQHDDSDSDLDDTENVTDDLMPIDTIESGKIYLKRY